RAAIVTDEFNLSQLGNGYFERVADSPQSRKARAFLRVGDLLQKIAAERIICLAYGAVRLTNELGDNVQVSDRLGKRRPFSKRPIHIDLFEVRLRQTVWVLIVVGIRPGQQ